MNKTIETIAHRAANEIVNTAKQDVDRVEVIVLQAIRDGIKTIPEREFAEHPWPKTNKKNPNRFFVSE